MPNHSKILVAVGTRPEIIKTAPIIRALQSSSIPFFFLHCGQHWDYNMSQQFIEELNLPAPQFNHRITTCQPAQQTVQIFAKTAKIIRQTRPRILITEGDTNTALATALAANKQKVSIGHVEAGLRSFDLRMPEEHNRRVVDHLSNFLFAPTERSAQNLTRENVWGKICITGNTIIDAVTQHLPIAQKKSDITKTIQFEEYALVTAHRQENVDNPQVLKNLIEAFIKSPLPIIYPLHPRTQKNLKKTTLWKKLSTSKNVQILSPVGYFDFLILMKNSRLIITDSGGIQEEATAPQIRKPVLVIRLSTERPEAVDAGFAKVVGTEKATILNEINNALNAKPKLPENSPYGNGDAAEKIVGIIKEIVNSRF
ncbi:MAG: non-hydrolyzing UDP-N-acetylglucosamine 2-epimerase [Candidatus Bathyarchaeales archaeon]